MKTALLSLVIGSALVLANSPAFAADPTPPPTPKLDAAAVAQANTAFALDLYAQLRAGKGNLFFAPQSISTALAMTYAGARGQTAAQMAKTLHLPDDPAAVAPAFAQLADAMMWRNERPAPYELAVANSLWGQKGYPFSPEFLAVLGKQYDAPLQQVAFDDTGAAAKPINAWVEKQTHDKIKELIGPGMVNGLTRLVLVNAVYFKASWQQPFAKSDTEDKPFTALVDGKPVPVKAPLMSREAHFSYFEEPGLQAVELPYVGGNLSMVVLLPAGPSADKPDAFGAFEKSLTPEKLAGWLGKMKSEVVIVSLPKFKSTGSFVLNDTLSAMGMPDAFKLDKADFGGMVAGKMPEPLCIGFAIHKSFVNVDEEGTEAAAASAIGIAAADGFAPNQIKHFRADHPFVFLIRHRATGSILFMGRVVDPTAE